MLARLRTLTHHVKMSTVTNTNIACCTVPAVHSDYTPKGSYKSFGGFQKVYVTGPEKSDNAIVAVYDIFGFFPQTQQGADMIASSLKTTVYMPDFFEPKEPFPTSKHPPKSDQDKADLQAFFGPDGAANAPPNIGKLIKLAQTLKSNGVKHVGGYGFCWGAKICILAGGDSTPLDAVAMVHPAMLSSDDATKLTVPLAMYISGDEPVEEVRNSNSCTHVALTWRLCSTTKSMISSPRSPLHPRAIQRTTRICFMDLPQPVQTSKTKKIRKNLRTFTESWRLSSMTPCKGVHRYEKRQTM